ncbi:MAG: hypothetical protein DI585_03375 [Pseudomonas fluorescens]|nr:MAG: hypothetical protein DI585_03375 [Pseudomonas fluorescens]
MKTALHAILIFIILLMAVLLLGQLGSAPMPVSITIAEHTATTTAPVAILVGLMVIIAAFYLGRFTGWMLRLPNSMLRRRRENANSHLADAYAAFAMNDGPTALKHLKAYTPDSEIHADLADLLTLQLPADPTSPPPFLEKKLANPRLAALASLVAARFYAQQNQWDEVARITAIGRQHIPTNPALLVLQFKALVNTNSPQAGDLLPALKPQLGAERTKLLGLILQGPNTLTARPLLDTRWVKSIQTWLPTASETFPEA